MSSLVYSLGTRPKQWDNFEEFKNNAAKEELIELTNHPNGVVKSYSFWAISLINNVNLFSIAKDPLNDYELINTQFGCIGGQEVNKRILEVLKKSSNLTENWGRKAFDKLLKEKGIE